MAYTKFPRGSEWRKWDLHIHTPETKKNDNFDGSTPAEKWEKYIESINNSNEEISVVGITDYLSIDNYFKFKKAIADDRITKKFDLILPNIELRVLPVTGSATPINLHCIFNSAIESEITTRFLSKLKFAYAESDYSAQPDELKRLGRALPGKSTLDDTAALKAGIGQYVIEMSTLSKIFKDDKKLRDNTIIVVSNKSGDGVSGIVEHSDYFVDGGSQLNATRWAIYQFSDAVFSSSEKDVKYFSGLGVDVKELVIEKCHFLMPCFHGCDAHVNAKIFNPDDKRYCWIKADPTFEGLKQTLYEPEDRVKIQAIKPDIKTDRYVISEIEYIDKGRLFGNKKIPLNENLNAIIGGKSSGKSLLMYSAARSIDPDQVDKTSKRLSFDGYKLGADFDFHVIWKNGEIDILSENGNKPHKITYIPQLYINHLVERNNKQDLNSLIESILLQDTDFKNFYEEKIRIIGKLTADIITLLGNYLQVRTKLIDVQQKIKDIGKSSSIKTGIDALKLQITAGQNASNLSREEFDTYNDLTNKKTSAEKVLKEFQEKEIALERISDELHSAKQELLGTPQSIDTIPLRGTLDIILDTFSVLPTDLNDIVVNISKDFDELIQNLETSIVALDLDNLKTAQKKVIDDIVAKLFPIESKLAGQLALQKLTTQLQGEEKKYDDALLLEKQLISYSEDYKNIRDKKVLLLKERHATYEAIAKKINDTRNDIGTGITLDVRLLYRQSDLQLFEQANKAAIPEKDDFYKIFSDNLVNYEEVINLYSNQLRIIDNKLIIGPNIEKNIPLKQKITIEEVLRGLLGDSFYLDYTVTYKGDDLLSMSPGKKGTVLLILFLQISSSEFPIFIDQPEDNLDNRTIYDLLCTMIKLKKKDRQIIIVSHNANLVIATDAENIIVANQEGQDADTTGKGTRFDYVNGSLEYSFAKNETIREVLMQQGIKEHACDILEGGDEAFKQRERKYSIK